MNNTILRTISGVGFIAVMVAGLLLDKLLFAGLVMFIMAIMMHEFYTITMNDRYRFSRLLAILSGLPIMVVMVNSLYVKDKTEFGKFSDIYTGILYIAVPLSLSNLIVFFGQQFNGIVLLCFFIIIWSSDVGGYIFGSTLGKRFSKKLFPDISPKKTWVGFWGGMFCSILSAIVLKYAMHLPISLINTIVLAIVMDISGVYGDLFESQWKRHYNVKDSGTIIPGHGGMLDRFDSTLMAMPVGALYLILMNIF